MNRVMQLFAVLVFIAIVAGVPIAWSGFNDMRRYRMPVVSKRWWWFEHMNRFLSGYIATVTAFMVQNVTRMLPLDYSWVVWVAPGVLGGFLVARWIAHYRAKFGEPQPQGIKWLKRSAPTAVLSADSKDSWTGTAIPSSG